MTEVTTTEGRWTTLAARFGDVRATTERLASPLSAEDQTVQSMPEVSPTKWHRAHTSWFFETFLLEPGLSGYNVFDPAYAYLFNSYYESVGVRHPRAERGVVSRPGAAEVGAYRAYVDEYMNEFFGTLLSPRQALLVELGVNHEQQHQELLLMDIKHVLSCNPQLPVYLPRPTRLAGNGRKPAMGGWIEHQGGLVDSGCDGRDFSFDNELPRYAVHLTPFAVSSAPATCGDWLAFMEDGGYSRPELWLSDGWAAVQEHNWKAPLYWSRTGPNWQVFTLHGPSPVDPDEPVVHVSYYEADAFARWSGARLPTEAEWETVAVQLSSEGHFLEPDVHGSLLHPAPGGKGLMGDVWQWTSSAYGPYPGFAPAEGAVGEYNGKFMVNQMVLRGGCCVTPAGHARPTYRNFFPPQSRWPFAGVRLARDC